MDKTGTSTLQHELTSRQRGLAERGVLYPVLDGSTNHLALNALIRDFARVPRYLKVAGRRDEASMRRFGQSYWDEMCRTVRASDANLAVVSSEHFFHLRDDEVERLHDLLSSTFDEIDVIAYVRSPSSYYVATSQQRVKASYAIVPPARFRLPIRRCLERHRTVFGGRLVVRGYDRSQLRDGDIVRDFAHIALPDHGGLPLRSSRRELNRSMSAEAMCIVQEFRRQRFPGGNDDFNPDTRRVVDAIAALPDGVPQTVAVLRPDAASIIEENHRPDLAWLTDEFGVVFDPGRDGAHDPDETYSGTSDDLAQILAVDRAQIETVLYALLHEATSGGSLRERASHAGRRLRRSVAGRLHRAE